MLTIDVEKLRATAAGSVFTRRVAAHVLADCERIHAEPLIKIEMEPGRKVMLPTARRLFQRVTTLAIGDCLAGGMRNRLRGRREIAEACAFPDWNPTHFLDTAEMMAAVALGLFWFGPVMGEVERRAVREALIDKGLRPGLEAFDADAFWVTARHNWNTVCCGGMIVAAVVLRQEARGLSDTVLERCREAMAAGLSAYGADGGYPEGPSYWEFATRYAVLAHAALLEAGLIDRVQPSLAKSWRFARDMTAPSGAVFDCGDTDAQVPRSPVLGWLARISNDPDAAAWQRAAPGEPSALDLLWCGPEAACDGTTSLPPAPSRLGAEGRGSGMRGMPQAHMAKDSKASTAPSPADQSGEPHISPALRTPEEGREGATATSSIGGRPVDAGSEIGEQAIAAPPHLTLRATFSPPGRREEAETACPDSNEDTAAIPYIHAYEPAGMAVLRCGRAWAGLKGGRNDANHAHLDLGSFLYEIDGIRFASDIGRENYAVPGYFDPIKRFSYFRTRTEAHGTLRIDGREQSVAMQARLLGTAARPDRLAVAYALAEPESAVSWQRGLQLRGDGRLAVVDEVEADGAQRLTWQIHTLAEVTLAGRRALLRRDGVSVAADIIEPEEEAWQAAPARSPPGESDNSAYTRLWFETDGPARLRVDFSPEGAGEVGVLAPISEWGLGIQAGGQA